jgi:hypothetical protein
MNDASDQDSADQAQTDQLVFDCELDAPPQKVWRALSIAGFRESGRRHPLEDHPSAGGAAGPAGAAKGRE